MTDYSQSGEQTAILAAFEGRECQRRFMDIGAWHPVQFSNSRALYELGWRGVMIEPSPQPMLNLIDAYGNDERITLIQAAVSLIPGFVSLHVSDDAISTASETEYERWKDAAKFRGRITVPVITLAQIAAQFGGFDFVSVDTEGTSAELFLQMLGLELFPTCVCVEHDGRLVEICEAATRNDYKLVFSNATNAVMVRG